MKNIRGYFNVYISELYRAIFSLFPIDCSALHTLHSSISSRKQNIIIMKLYTLQTLDTRLETRYPECSELSRNFI